MSETPELKGPITIRHEEKPFTDSMVINPNGARIKNLGNEPAPVNFGEHFYWAAPQGWEGLTINGEDVTDAVKNDLVIPLQGSNKIVIPGLPEITLEQRGLPYGNLWVYRDEASGKYDQDYVCIEPVEGDPTKNFFGSPESLIPPGFSRNTVIIISVKP